MKLCSNGMPIKYLGEACRRVVNKHRRIFMMVTKRKSPGSSIPALKCSYARLLEGTIYFLTNRIMAIITRIHCKGGTVDESEIIYPLQGFKKNLFTVSFTGHPGSEGLREFYLIPINTYFRGERITTGIATCPGR